MGSRAAATPRLYTLALHVDPTSAQLPYAHVHTHTRTHANTPQSYCQRRVHNGLQRAQAQQEVQIRHLQAYRRQQGDCRRKHQRGWPRIWGLPQEADQRDHQEQDCRPQPPIFYDQLNVQPADCHRAPSARGPAMPSTTSSTSSPRARALGRLLRPDYPTLGRANPAQQQDHLPVVVARWCRHHGTSPPTSYFAWLPTY